MKAAIFGATGYTGSLLLKLVLLHPYIKEVFAFSTSQQKQKIKVDSDKLKYKTFLSYDKLSELDFDVIFSALPHLSSSDYYNDYIGKKIIIDLSADLRLDNKELFIKSYGKLPFSEKYIGKSVYGLSELNHNQIKKSDLIANPGCYPTAILLSILPIVKEISNISNIIINAMSGLTGAGKKAKIELLYSERADNVNVYSPGSKHRHFYEIKEKVDSFQKNINLSFNPYLIPINRGIYSNCSIVTEQEISVEKIKNIFEFYYSDKPFIKIVPLEDLQLKEIIGTNYCYISYAINANHLHIFSCIDNLMKGSAGAAIQNLNIRLGFPETAGLPIFNYL